MEARFAALFAGAALLLPAQPKKQEEDLPVIKVDVDLVNLLCSVRDRRNALIANLSKDDFVVREDGKEQEIRYFARESDLPMTVGMLVDVSRSQEGLIEIERSAASEFFRQVLRPKDMAFLISFGADIELLQDFTSSVNLLRRGLDQLRLSTSVGGIHPGPVPTSSKPKGTVLYDAVYLAATEKLRREVGRKAIVMISDGMDFGSHYKLEHALEQAQKSDAIIYSIYYVDPRAYGGFFGVSDSALKKMSEETGGRLFNVGRRQGLPEIFREIQEELRSQYSIGYVPTNANRDGAFRKVDIRTTNKDLKVQARKGYFAQRPG